MTPNAEKLLRDVVRALRNVDIRCSGTPKLVRRPPSRGLFVTDNKRVFVKLTTTAPTLEWAGARHAAACGITTPRPLHKPVPVDEHWWALPFKWLPTDPAAPDSAAVAQTLARIWSAPAPHPAREMPWDAYEARARANIDRATTPASLQTMLHRLIDATLTSVHTHLSTTATPPSVVWTHGDLHGDNLMVSNGQVHVLDWEHHGLSIRENEAAKYLQTLLAEHHESDAGDFLHAMTGLGLDVGLIWRLAGLRAAGAAGFLIGYGNQNIHAERLAQYVDVAHRSIYQPVPRFT